MVSDRLSQLVGFAGTAVVLGVLVWVVGLGDLVAALSRAEPRILALVLAAALAWLVAWGLGLLVVVRAMGASLSIPMSVLVMTAAVFSNNVTPFGQAGGEPLSGLLISEAADAEYETGLAAIATVDALHFVPSVGLATVGFVAVAVDAVALDRNVLFAAGLVAAFALALPVAAYLGWRYRYEFEAAVVRLLTPVVRRIGGLVPRFPTPSRDAIEGRIEGFFHSIDRITDDRRTLLASLGFSTLGWLAICASLWLSLYSVGEVVAVGAVLFAVPVAKIAGLAPLPGGSGAIEGVLAVMLAATTAVPFSVALSAVFVHRGATYLLPVVVGGGVASALGAERGRT